MTKNIEFIQTILKMNIDFIDAANSCFCTSLNFLSFTDLLSIQRNL